MEQQGNTTAKLGNIEVLRLILEHEQSRHIVYEEALDIGESLITFFEVLAESAADDE
jgi:hypothetical protein